MHYARDAFQSNSWDTIIPHSLEENLPFVKTRNHSRGMSIIDIVELSRNYGKHTNTMCLPPEKVLLEYYDLKNTENTGRNIFLNLKMEIFFY